MSLQPTHTSGSQHGPAARLRGWAPRPLPPAPPRPSRHPSRGPDHARSPSARAGRPGPPGPPALPGLPVARRRRRRGQDASTEETGVRDAAAPTQTRSRLPPGAGRRPRAGPEVPPPGRGQGRGGLGAAGWWAGGGPWGPAGPRRGAPLCGVEGDAGGRGEGPALRDGRCKFPRPPSRRDGRERRARAGDRRRREGLRERGASERARPHGEPGGCIGAPRGWGAASGTPKQ